jgi:hypothetical protein
MSEASKEAKIEGVSLPENRRDGNDQASVDPPLKQPLVLPTRRDTETTRRAAVQQSTPRLTQATSQIFAFPDTCSEPPPTAMSEQYGPFCRPADLSVQHARNRLLAALQQTYKLRRAFTDRVYEKYRVCLIQPRPVAALRAELARDCLATLTRVTTEISVLQEEKETEKKIATAIPWESESESLSYYAAGLNLIILPEQVDVAAEDLEGCVERCPTDPVTGQRAKNMSQAAATAGDAMLERKRKALVVRLEHRRLAHLGDANSTTSAATTGIHLNTSRPRISSIAATMLTSQPSIEARTPAISSSTKTAPRSTTPSTTNRANGATLSAVVAGKAGRSRAPSGLSAATLLSLNPSAEEISKTPETGKASAATMALVARGGVRAIANSNKMTQQRLQHPYPESLGGRRRSSMNSPRKEAPAGANSTSRSVPQTIPQPVPEPFLQSYLQLTLPPLPAAKERLERKPLQVFPASDASTKRAMDSVRIVLGLFGGTSHTTELRDLGRIELLQRLYQLDNNLKEESKSHGVAESIPEFSVAASQQMPGTHESSQVAQPFEAPNDETGIIDPILTYSVLQAVGLIGQIPISGAKREFSLPNVNENNFAVWSSKLLLLQKAILSTSPTFSASILSNHDDHGDGTDKRKRGASIENSGEGQGKRQKRATILGADVGSQGRVEQIRGGEALPKADEGKKIAEERVGKSRSSRTLSDASDKSKISASRKNSDASDKSRREKKSPSASDSGPGSTQISQIPQPAASVAASHSHSRGVIGGNHTPLSTMQLATHIQQLHHPAVGSIADYIGSLQAQAGFDLSTLVPSGPSSALSSIATGGGLVGYNLQDRAVAEHALLLREQHTAAFLSTSNTFQQHPSAPYSLVRAHPDAISALLNAQLAMNAPGDHQSASEQEILTETEPLKADKEASATDSARSRDKPANKSQIPAKESQPIDSDTKKERPDCQDGRTLTHKQDRSESESPEIDDSHEQKAMTSALLTSPHLTEEEGTVRDISSFVVAAKEEEVPKSPRRKSEELCMKIFVPDAPAAVSPEAAILIRSGHFYKAAQGTDDIVKLTAFVEYLHEAGAAVPIQKALVLAPVKERLNAPGFKVSSSLGGPPISRDVVTATILVWLWAKHEISFQKAFEKSGRIDVDPDCKWLIQAAVDASIRQLSLADTASARGGPSETAAARKGQNLKPPPVSCEPDRETVSKMADIHNATVVSTALTTMYHIDPYINHAILRSGQLVAYLDESRLGALRAKSQERVLLATLLARKSTLSESFSHAYVSAMVRAGEALGHGKLFEIAQNEEVLASTMIPYDIFTDETGAWEDPCQPKDSFTAGLTGDDLLKRAHARAMIQKSLRKLQDRHNIRGGALDYGPYEDQSDKDPSKGVQGRTGGVRTSFPRPSLKRRYSSISEPPVPTGTGSAKATSRFEYDPKHFSDPLKWYVHHLENMPYGRHRRGHRGRSMSLGGRDGGSLKKAKRSLSIPGHAVESPDPSPPEASTALEENSKLPKSTAEVDWGDVAGTFHSVEIVQRKPSASRRAADSHDTVPLHASGNIFAPFCRKIEGELSSDSVEEEDDEDLNDEAVLANHEIVLDEMKKKIAIFVEEQKKQQERRKNRFSK